MSVYSFDHDSPGSGKSACTGDCLAAWPPVHADDDTPRAEGVTGDLGTIEGNDGELQVTLGGRPLYLYAGDDSPGDVMGQGLDGIWWVLAPSGDEITQMPAGGPPGY
jgi:predicted lipoprotein with Yx(FWY)xxD motif